MIHHDMSFEEYRRLPGVNAHAVMTGRKTIEHMRSYISGESKDVDTEGRKLGRAVHTKLLEPDRFDALHPAASPCSAIIASGERKGSVCGRSAEWIVRGPIEAPTAPYWLCGTHAKSVADASLVRDAIDADELRKVLAIESGFRNAGRLSQFRKRGWSEVVIQWEWCGVPCKARIDRMSEDGSMFFDIKTVAVGRADQSSFESTSASLGYHVQMAFYNEAIRSHFGQYANACWMIAESDAPHCVNVLDCAELAMQIGRHECIRILERWQHAQRTSVYPGYIDDHTTQSGGLPEWYLRQFRDIDLGGPIHHVHREF